MTVTISLGLTERRTEGDADTLINGEVLSRSVANSEELGVSLGAPETEMDPDGDSGLLAAGGADSLAMGMGELESKEEGENSSDFDALSPTEGEEEGVSDSLPVLLGVGSKGEAIGEGTGAEMETSMVFGAVGVLDSNVGLGNADAEGEFKVTELVASGVGIRDADAEAEEETEAVGDEG